MIIYYYCPDLNLPSGGVRTLYRHVDLLRKAGLDAKLLHNNPGFRCTWFQNDTVVEYVNSSSLEFSESDFIVLPEILGPQMTMFAPGIPKIVFNQNAYYTFNGYDFDLDGNPSPYASPDVKAVLVVSEDNYNYLKWVFPGILLRRVVYSLNQKLFYYDSSQKENLIAIMPRKGFPDALQIFNILKYRGTLRGWNVILIHDQSEEDAAKMLRKSRIFLSMLYHEGCPFPPMEAMACGCHVIGYSGRGGDEYFTEQVCRKLEPGDVCGVARAIEELIEISDSDPCRTKKQSVDASQAILAKYSVENERTQLLAFWEEMIAR